MGRLATFCLMLLLLSGCTVQRPYMPRSYGSWQQSPSQPSAPVEFFSHGSSEENTNAEESALRAAQEAELYQYEETLATERLFRQVEEVADAEVKQQALVEQLEFDLHRAKDVTKDEFQQRRLTHDLEAAVQQLKAIQGEGSALLGAEWPTAQ